MKEITVTIQAFDKAIEALAFYANPESYHAISIFGDRPCGEFADDMDENHGFDLYDRPMPGSRAREALRAMGIKVGGTAEDDDT
jgi:hypothetical protein